MKISTHSLELTAISKLLSTNNEDCVAWIEDFLTEIRVDEDTDDTLFEKLGENLHPDQVSLVSQMLLEHYKKEKIVSRSKISGLVYNLKII